MRKFTAFLSTGLLCLVVMGAVIRLTIADTFYPSALVYYVTPPAAMTLMLLLIFVLTPKTKAKRKRLVLSGLACSAVWTFAAQWSFNPSVDSASDAHSLRVLFWNVCEGKLGWDNILQIVEDQNADVILLAEAETLSLSQQHQNALKQRFADYEVLTFPRRLLLLSQIPVSSVEKPIATRSGLFQVVELDSPQGKITLLFADIKSSLTSSRREPIRQLTEIAGNQHGPVLIAGDLNTPVDSVFFEELRQNHQNAFEASGFGPYVTWPMPLPVLGIDHLWGNQQIRFLGTDITWSIHSDHRALVADFLVQSAKIDGETN